MCTWLWWHHTGGTDPAIGFTIIHSVSKTRTSCRHVAGTLASDIFEADRAVLGSGAHHRLGLTSEEVGCNRVRW